MVTRCKEGKEKNKNGRCVKKCRDLFERNSAGKCKKVTPPYGYMLNLLTNRFIRINGPTGEYIRGVSPKPRSMGVLTPAQKKLVNEMRSKMKIEAEHPLAPLRTYVANLIQKWERESAEKERHNKNAKK